MSERDSPFKTELEQLVFEPKRKLVHEARRPQRSIRDQLTPHRLRLLSLELSGTLSDNLILASDLKKTVKTVSRTFVNVTLNTSQISMSLRPGLSIDVAVMGVASLEKVAWVFGEDEPRIDLRDVGFGKDPRGLILDQVMKEFGDAFRASAFARPGYDWTRDPRLFDNLSRFCQAVSDPFEPRGPFVAGLLLDSLKVTAMTLNQSRTPPNDENIFASVDENSSIVVAVDFQAFMGDLIDGFKASGQVLADTVILNSIQIQCLLRLFVKCQEVGRIQSLDIARDGRVFIGKFVIVNPKAVAIENTINAGSVTLAFFVNLFSEGVKLMSIVTTQTDPAALALRGDAVNQALTQSLGTVVGGARDAELDILSNQIKEILEPILTDKIRQVMRENLRAIPGVDLTAVFDLPKDLK
jgi:hypothetical protein